MHPWCTSHPTIACGGKPDWSLTALFQPSTTCPAATYHDANNIVLFYAKIFCYSFWPTDGQPQEGVEGLQKMARTSVEEKIPQQLLHTLSGLLSEVKNSAVHRLAQKIMQKQQHLLPGL